MADLSLRVLGANRTLVHIGETQVFFSYNTPVAAFIPERGYVVTTKKYSVTTNRHIREYVGDHSVEFVSPSWLSDLLTVKD